MGCAIDVKANDQTTDITGVKQPSLLIVHGTEDSTVPYVNGKEVFDQAQKVGLPSAMVSIQGADHVPWDYIFSDQYWIPIIKNIYDGLDLKDA